MKTFSPTNRSVYQVKEDRFFCIQWTEEKALHTSRMNARIEHAVFGRLSQFSTLLKQMPFLDPLFRNPV